MWMRRLFLIAAIGSAHTSVYAAQDHSTHGGQVRTAGPHRFELVAGKNELTLYVTDEAGEPVPSIGGTAKAIVMTGKKRWVLILSGAGDNKLEGTGEFTLGKSSPVTVIVKLPESDSQLVHFKLSKKARAKAHKR
jgi:hypothetical protein